MWIWFVDVVSLLFGIFRGLLKILFCLGIVAAFAYWYNLGCPLPDLPSALQALYDWLVSPMIAWCPL